MTAGASAEALRACAAPVRSDLRGPKAAVSSLWSRIHGEVYKREGACLREAFDALAAECGVDDPTSYLGPVLKKMSPDERADALVAAAACIDKEMAPKYAIEEDDDA